MFFNSFQLIKKQQNIFITSCRFNHIFYTNKLNIKIFTTSTKVISEQTDNNDQIENKTEKPSVTIVSNNKKKKENTPIQNEELKTSGTVPFRHDFQVPVNPKNNMNSCPIPPNNTFSYPQPQPFIPPLFLDHGYSYVPSPSPASFPSYNLNDSKSDNNNNNNSSNSDNTNLENRNNSCNKLSPPQQQQSSMTPPSSAAPCPYPFPQLSICNMYPVSNHSDSSNQNTTTPNNNTILIANNNYNNNYNIPYMYHPYYVPFHPMHNRSFSTTSIDQK